MKTVFITGGTGFVGSRLCAKLLKDPENFLFIMARGKGKKSGTERVRGQLNEIGVSEDCFGRIRVVEGNLESENLGIENDAWEELKKNVTAIYHCAASVKFALPYKDAERINYLGTKGIINLLHEAKNSSFDRFHYVSTAYVAGSISEGFSEKDLWRKQHFNNTYEMTKFKCEQLLQNEMKEGYPITIYRPSIISSSTDGSTHKNSIMQKFVKLFQSGRISRFLCSETSSLNLVPIDYFIDGMVELGSRKDTIMKTYQLVNEENVNIRELIKTYCRLMHVRPPEFVDYPDSYKKEEDTFGHFSDYIKLSHHFSDEVTREVLSNTAIRCGSVNQEYIEKNVEYCRVHGLI